MSVRERLKQDLKQAMKERNRPAVSALKSALSAIDNAGAVDAETTSADSTSAAIGSGGFAPDVPRRELTEDEVIAIVRAEADELRSAAAEYEGYGRSERAEELRAALRALAPHVGAA